MLLVTCPSSVITHKMDNKPNCCYVQPGKLLEHIRPNQPYSFFRKKNLTIKFERTSFNYFLSLLSEVFLTHIMLLDYY